MAVSFEIRIGYLFAKLLAHAFRIFVYFYPARAISVFLFKPLSHRFYYFFILVQPYSHGRPPLVNYTRFFIFCTAFTNFGIKNYRYSIDFSVVKDYNITK